MPSKTISNDRKLAAVKRILSGESTASDEARRLNVVVQAVRQWRRKYEAEHPEEKRPAPPKPPPPPPETAPAPEPPEDGGLNAARAAAGLPPIAGLGRAPESTPAAPAAPQPPSPSPLPTSRQEDEDLVFFYAGLLVSGEIRIPLALLTLKKPFKVPMTPELEAQCVLSNGEKEALRPAAPILARKIREWMGSSENAALVGAGVALGLGSVQRFAAVSKAVSEAAEKWRREQQVA